MSAQEAGSGSAGPSDVNGGPSAVPTHFGAYSAEAQEENQNENDDFDGHVAVDGFVSTITQPEALLTIPIVHRQRFRIRRRNVRPCCITAKSLLTSQRLLHHIYKLLHHRLPMGTWSSLPCLP